MASLRRVDVYTAWKYEFRGGLQTFYDSPDALCSNLIRASDIPWTSWQSSRTTILPEDLVEHMPWDLIDTVFVLSAASAGIRRVGPRRVLVVSSRDD